MTPSQLDALRLAKDRPRRHAMLRLDERYGIGSRAQAAELYARHSLLIARGGLKELGGVAAEGSRAFVVMEGRKPFYPVARMLPVRRRGPSVPVVVTYLNVTMVFENYAR